MPDQLMETPRTFHYPISYRLIAGSGAVMFGLIGLLSILAALDAVRQSRIEIVLHVGSLIGSWLLMMWGLDFATRSIAITPDGLRISWLLRRSVVPWSNVLGWRYRALDVIHIRLRRGPGVFVWPVLEHYTELLNEIDTHRNDRVTR